MPLFVWVICAAFVIFMVDLVSRRKRLSDCVRNLPKIPLSAIVPFLRPNKTSTEVFECLEKIFNYHDGSASMLVGTKLTVLFDDPENIKTILLSKDCVDKPYYYRHIAGGDGLFTANGICDKNNCHSICRTL